MIAVYLGVLLVGLGLALPSRKTLGFVQILTLGIAGYLVVTNWLSYTKNLPGRPFMGIEGLAGGYVPVIMSLPFFLYLPWKKTWARIAEGSIAILITGLIIISLAGIIQIAPSQDFERQVESARVSSVVPSYGSGLKLEGARTVGKGVETLFAYLPQINIYRLLVSLSLVILGWQIYEAMKKPFKFDAREFIGLVILGLGITSGKLMFDDLLPLLIFLTLGRALFFDWAGNYEAVTSGIIWAGMLMINPVACLYLFVPLLLLYDPKKLIYASGVALLINPLMIGGWL